MRSVSSDRIERWLGKDNATGFSGAMRGWYGSPIALGGTPGSVYVGKDGDYVGKLDVGYEASLEQMLWDMSSKERFGRSAWLRKQGGGIGSYAALRSSRIKHFGYQKVGGVSVTGAVESLWAATPNAGGAAAAAPGGTQFTTSTTGSLPYLNDSGGTSHFLSGSNTPSFTGVGILIYDRLFGVTKTMNSTATEAVTGVPTRYQSTTAGNADSAENNFLMVECRTVLAATAHNWTTCLYTDQSGNTGVTLPSVAGVSACAARRLDMPLNTWFCPLGSGDTGIQALTRQTE